jgi:hypothetical protein
VHFLRRGKTAVLSWGAVSGAKVYRVKVTGSDGRIDTFFAKPSQRSETLPGVLPAESFKATITAVGGKDLLEGRPAAVRLKPLKIKAPSPAKRHASKRKGKRKR